MKELKEWQNELADLMRERCILNSEYLYKLKKVQNDYVPKLKELDEKMQKIYVDAELIAQEESDGKIVQELQ